MRGYEKLKKQNRLNRISIIVSEISQTNLNINAAFFSKSIYGNGINSAEKIIRQYLIKNILDDKFNEQLLISVSKNRFLVYPLPRLWQKIIENNGFKIKKYASSLLWYKYVSMQLLKGYLMIIRNIAGYFIYRETESSDIRSSIFFTNLTKSNISRKYNETNDYDVFSWFIKNQNRLGINFDTIYHLVPNSKDLLFDGIKISYNPRIIPRINNIYKFSKFFKSSFDIFFRSLVDYFRGYWWNCIILVESISSIRVRLSSSNEIAKSYYFSNSNWIYRPLWTYEAETKGAEVALYFYSTNCKSFETTEGNNTYFRGYNSMNWSKYLVWDNHQLNFIKEAIDNESQIVVVGPIWFQDSCKNFEIPHNSLTIAVFDVQPLRNSSYQKLALYPEYYTSINAIGFLKDISNLIKENGYVMIWKKKRDIGEFINKEFRNFTQNLVETNDIVIVDPEISAFRVIEKCTAVISMPFTSTAVIAKTMGKPSIYYDPFGMILKDDKASHEIQIITGINELNEWISNLKPQ